MPSIPAAKHTAGVVRAARICYQYLVLKSDRGVGVGRKSHIRLPSIQPYTRRWEGVVRTQTPPKYSIQAYIREGGEGRGVVSTAPTHTYLQPYANITCKHTVEVYVVFGSIVSSDYYVLLGITMVLGHIYPGT